MWWLFSSARLDRIEQLLRVIHALVQGIDLRLQRRDYEVINISENLTHLRGQLDRLIQLQENQTALLERWWKWTKARFGPRPPQPLRWKVVGESRGGFGMADQIHFKVLLPPWPSGTDITHGELTWAVEGQEANMVRVPFGATEAGEFSGPQGATVVVQFWYVDDAGNPSTPATAQATLADVIPPPPPGELGIVLTGESRPEPEPGEGV